MTTTEGASKPTATSVLGDYAATLTLDDLGPEVLEQTRRVVEDTVGVLVAASRTAVIRGLAVNAISRGGGREATLIGHRSKVAAETAAFINGAAGHQIELDDSHGPSLTHPAAVMVPAALVAAEMNPAATGADLVAGLVAGYDVSARFSKACGVQSIVDRGFHATSVCGTIGAAAAAGRILGLDPGGMTAALGLAASLSCGLLTWEDDPTHVAKSFQTGAAAENGIRAALLASTGYAGALDALGGRYNAISAFGGPDADAAELTADLGTRFEILATDYKRYASCRHTHAPVDGLLELFAEHDLKAGDVVSIDAELPHSSVPVVDRNPLWTHNLQYVLALAAIEGAVLPEHFEPAWTSDPRILDLAARITLRGNDELEAAYPQAKGAVITITTTSVSYVRKVPLPVGHRDRPIPDDALADKFDHLVEPSLTVAARDELRGLLQRLETLPSMAAVMSVLTAGPDPH